MHIHMYIHMYTYNEVYTFVGNIEIKFLNMANNQRATFVITNGYNSNNESIPILAKKE